MFKAFQNPNGGKLIQNLFVDCFVKVNDQNYLNLFTKNLDISYYYEYLEKFQKQPFYAEKNLDKKSKLKTKEYIRRKYP